MEGMDGIAHLGVFLVPIVGSIALFSFRGGIVVGRAPQRARGLLPSGCLEEDCRELGRWRQVRRRVSARTGQHRSPKKS